MDDNTTPRRGRPPGRQAAEGGLTDRQAAIVGYITQTVAARGYPPTMREIGHAVKLASSSSVAHQLMALERKGVLYRDPHTARAYQVRSSWAPDAKGPAEANAVEVPLVGRIAAGAPLLADQIVEDVYTLPRQITGGHSDVFALTVSGDSMIDAAICDGDIVTVQRTDSADHGDIVAALLGDEATVKVLRRQDGQVWLMPRNPAYEPIPGDDARILGKVVGVLRVL
ncbi:transcriptional repressor LexA [Streptomyces sp. MBT33]|uniref:LexA repressor n=1 Tax=Streptomyces gilvifuscus TaxID=1550617 RepID=A0ABT5G0C3_9ACTN|nr:MULTISPECIES: transcriptional repressor LexA [Streptomyces]MBK3646517.1 transcriptional repressor LexA [Streptomyces sp. MBT33]MDC2958106.1 transcriptional repressor LexA [Streptomyces gilvifuscus]